MARKRSLEVLLLTLVMGLMGCPAVSWAAVPEGCFPSVFGTQFADVNGDRKADAIIVHSGRIFVRLSDGTQFLPGGKEYWTFDSFASFSSTVGAYFTDVTGDGMADAIVVDHTGVSVGPSDGERFHPGQAWMAWTTKSSGGTTNEATNDTFLGWRNRTYGAVGMFFADVTADQAADAVSVFDNGTFVRPAFASVAFGPAESWATKVSYGSKGTYFADVTGDGAADAVVVSDSGVTVRRSLTYAFGGNESWAGPYYGDTGYFASAAGEGRGGFFADVTGDGKADAIVVNQTGITVRRSDGKQFLSNESWAGAYWGSIGTYFADVDGDGKADAIAVDLNGIKVRRSDGTRFLSGKEWELSWTGPFYGDFRPA